MVFPTHDDDPGMVELTHVFALLRNPEWMGASTYLPAMEGKYVTILESEVLKNRPGMVIAGPIDGGQTGPDSRETDFPQEGEAQLLKQILEWHGTVLCHWISNE